MKFITPKFMLETEIAYELYETFAKNLPIIDYHCHISPQLIFENKSFDDLHKAWIGDDHYKWTAMRWAGIEETFITGTASPYEKFEAYASALPKCVGNPLHHWSHMELFHYFDFDGHLTSKNARSVWQMCNEKIKKLRPRDYLNMANVESICTTDDPIDDLHYHKLLQEDNTVGFHVYPAFRPDLLVNINKPTFCDYLKKLADVSGQRIRNLSELKICIINRLDHFEAHGCKLADHGLDRMVFMPADSLEVEDILQRRLLGATLSQDEADKYITYLLQFLSKEYHRRNWVLQLHFGVARNINTRMYDALGVDAGADSMHMNTGVDNLSLYLDSLDTLNCLPKTIVYSINPNDNPIIDTILGCFEKGPIKGLLQHGSAWWFNDSLIGMESYLKTLSSLTSLGSFIGMLTDSRSVLSYTRHEYFRRILCNYLGELVETGQYPDDRKELGELITSICYGNAKKYFCFGEENHYGN